MGFISLLGLALMACNGESQRSSPVEAGPEQSGSPKSGCGDGVCAQGENTITCAQDCTAYVDGDLQGLDCMADLGQESLNNELTIVVDVEQSYHEMVACGALTFLIAEAVSRVVGDLLDDPTGLTAPAGFTWENNAYVTRDGGSEMQVTFHYGDDLEAGPEDAVIEHDLFDADNYLKGIRFDVDYTTFELIVRYDERGPLVELLGFGAMPDRPLRIGLYDVDDLVGEMSRIKIASGVEVTDVREGGTDVSYWVTKVPQQLGPFLFSGALTWDVEDTAATREPQRMDTTSWAVDYSDNGLSGTIDFSVDGFFPYSGTYLYSDSGWATVSLTCDP
jgi:hypothetical protein